MEKKGKNRALFKNTYFEKASINSERCIFLSHATKDKDAVREIGEYIMKAGVDIYLDEKDSNLLAAIRLANNHDAVTACIENGLSRSTDILVIVSQDTRYSWWVPFEIGYGKKSEVEIATLLLEDVGSDIPSYLKITKLIGDIRGLNNYLDTLEKSTMYSEAFNYEYSSGAGKLLSENSKHPLSGYVKAVR